MKLARPFLLFTFLCASLFSCDDEDEVDLPLTVVSIQDFSASIAENPVANQSLGSVSATTSAGTLSYSLMSQSVSGAMSVDASSGELSVADASAFDFEKNQSLTAKVVAKANDVTDTASVTISLTNDENERIMFTDSNFETILIGDDNIDTDKDNEISEKEAKAYTGIIAISNRSISNVDELHFFPNITRLSAFSNSISSIDLSKNMKLTQILLENNDLTSLDVSMIPTMVDLKVHSNELTSLNVANGKNSNIIRMEAQGNTALTCIQIDEDFTPGSGWNKGAANYSDDCD